MKAARFRFYEELNDFLSTEKRKQAFVYSFSNNPSIKDTIEALGVPHTEIDLILINGQSVDFNTLLQDGDQVAVYPVFEALDITPIIHLRAKPLRKTAFILDVHLGKLARYLRLFGFDAAYENSLEDADIIRRAAIEKRIILTRDVGILKNKTVTHGVWLRATDPKKQLEEVLRRFNLINSAKPFSRCLECNTKLKKSTKEKVMPKLPTKTKTYYQDFFICPSCEKIYWQGSHYDKMLQFVTKILDKYAKIDGEDLMNHNKYAVLITAEAKPDMEEYVKRYLTQLMDFSRENRGCITYNIHQSADNPLEFMVYMLWESKQAFDKHNETPEMQAFKKELAKDMFTEQSPKTFWYML